MVLTEFEDERKIPSISKIIVMHIDILNETAFQVSAFLCYDTEDYEIIAKLNYYPYGLLISCIFLAITLVVYLSLPKVFNNDFMKLKL